jgi:hypothetical protein
MSSLHTPSPPPPRLTLRRLVSDFLRDVTDADRGLLATIWELTLRPGQVVTTYLHQDRSRFLRPTRYLVFCLSLAAIQLVAVQLWYGQSVEEMRQETSTRDREQSAEFDSLAELTAAEAAYHEWLDRTKARFHSLTGEFRSFFAMLVIPLFGLLYYALYARHGLNLAESIVAAAYLHAHVVFLSFLFLPLYFLGDSSQDYQRWFRLEEIATGLYLFVAVARVFGRGWRDTLLAIIGVVVLLLVLSITIGPATYIGAAMARTVFDPALGLASLSWKFYVYLGVLITVVPALFGLWFMLHPQRRRTDGRRDRASYMLYFVLLLVVGWGCLFWLHHT